MKTIWLLEGNGGSNNSVWNKFVFNRINLSMTQLVIENFRCQQFGDIQGQNLLWEKLPLLVWCVSGNEQTWHLVVCLSPRGKNIYDRSILIWQFPDILTDVPYVILYEITTDWKHNFILKSHDQGHLIHLCNNLSTFTFSNRVQKLHSTPAAVK